MLQMLVSNVYPALFQIPQGFTAQRAGLASSPLAFRNEKLSQICHPWI
jgi:hypothetical protein